MIQAQQNRRRKGLILSDWLHQFAAYVKRIPPHFPVKAESGVVEEGPESTAASK